MRAESAGRLSRLCFILALVLVLLALAWSLATPPPPSADRYDYAGRAFQATQGEDLSPLVGYPLRMVFPGAETWPPENLTRPPLWPALLVPGVHWGLEARSGVWVSVVFALLLLLGMRWVGDRSFGGGAGAMACLALATSYCSWFVLRGGGPEFSLALITLVLWTWIPRGGGVIAHLACGTLYGLLTLLHPTGWIFAGAAVFARPDRYERSQLGWILLGALLVALPWHLHLWTVMGNPLGTLQSYAELARNLDDPGGIGPYRGLQPHPTAEVLAERGMEVLRLGLHRLKMQMLYLDGWLSWPLAGLAIYGAIHEARLALRDVLLGIAVFAVLSPWSADFRTLLPLLPIACLWVGAGFSRLVDRTRPAVALALALIAALLPWALPLGASESPIHEELGFAESALSPPASLVLQLQRAGPAGAPIFTDSAVLAFRARRGALLLPIDPTTLETLRGHGALKSLRVIALGLGRSSHWNDTDEWRTYLASCEVLYQHPEGAVLLALPSRESALESEQAASMVQDSLARVEQVSRPRDSSVVVDRENRLAPDEVPENLMELAVPPASRHGLQLRSDAVMALGSLLAAAEEDRIELRVVSAYRSFQRQQELYTSAELRHGEGQAWVAPPGASEHQLGTTVDFVDAASRHVLEPSFAGTAEARWLEENAHRFGFSLSYPADSFERTGYHPEAWHYRYRPPRAQTSTVHADTTAGADSTTGVDSTTGADSTGRGPR